MPFLVPFGSRTARLEFAAAALGFTAAWRWSRAAELHDPSCIDGGLPRGLAGAVTSSLRSLPHDGATGEATFAACERVARVLGCDGVTSAGTSVQVARDARHLLRGLLDSKGVALPLRDWLVRPVSRLVIDQLLHRPHHPRRARRTPLASFAPRCGPAEEATA